MKNRKTALALTAWLAVSGSALAMGEDDPLLSKVMIDRLEWRDAEGDPIVWDADAWVGRDLNKLWLKTEGERSNGGMEEAEVQLLYSRAVSPFWDLQTGVAYQRVYGSGPDGSDEGGLFERAFRRRVERLVERRVDSLVERVSPRLARVRDLRGRYQDAQERYQRLFRPPGPDRDRAYAVVGLQGLAPYWFEVDTSLRLSEEGDVSLDLEAEYEWLITQRLVLQPRLETSLAFQSDEDVGVGRGLAGVTAGLRLSYEIRREFAPYVGVSWQKKLGASADLARADGEDPESVSVVAGVRIWF